MTAVALARPTPRWEGILAAARPERIGIVQTVVGLSIEVSGLDCAVGGLVQIGEPGQPAGSVLAEVVATTRGVVRCMPLAAVRGLRAGAPVRSLGRSMTVPVGRALLGRVLDGLGRPIDGRGPLGVAGQVPIDSSAPGPLTRTRIVAPLSLGVRVMDTLTTVGRGQRLGLFAGSGVGKSSLLSMIARGTDAELTVIALVGERAIEHDVPVQERASGVRDRLVMVVALDEHRVQASD